MTRIESRQAQKDRIAALAVGRFLRALQVLLRSARLYQKNHPHLLESLEGAEQTLRTAFDHVSPLSVKFERGNVLFRNHPLADARGELKALAEELERRGVRTLLFSRETNLGELNSLAMLLNAAARNGTGIRHTAAEWPRLFDAEQISGIRVNALPEEKKADTALAGLIATVLQLDLKAWMEGATETAVTPEAATPEELISAVSLLGEVARNFVRPRTAAGEDGEPARAVAPAEALRESFSKASGRTVTILLAALQKQAPREGEGLESYFSRLAESLILSFGGRYMNGAEGRVPGLRTLFIRVAREVAASMGADPEAAESGFRLLRVPPSITQWTEEAAAEHLHQRFWDDIPAREKSAVLRGPEAWCVPVESLHSYLDHLARGGGEREARLVLLNYARCLESPELAARRAVATGLSEFGHLAETLWPGFLPEELSRSVVRALLAETAPDVAAVLAAVTNHLVRLAVKKTDFAEFERILNGVEKGSQAASGGARTHITILSESLLQEGHWRKLMDTALDNRPLDAALPRILGRDPTRVLENLTARLAAPGGLEILPAMARLVRGVGEAALGALVTQAFDPRNPRATAAVKLLAAAKPERLVEILPRALPSWDWNLQDMAVSELARQRVPRCAAALLESLPHAHPLVVPMMIDEIGLSEEADALPVLMEIAAGKHERFRDVFVRIKAVEALGRMRAPGAADLLRAIVRERNGLMHVEPAGLRAAAEDALGLIENRPSSARVRATQTATERAYQPYSGQPGTRPRRYLRIPLDSPLPARIDGAAVAGPAPVRVQTISMGGAFLESSRRLNVGDALTVEIKAGLRNIQSTAVVRNVTPAGGGVEFVHMKQDDREKLRQLISRLTRG